MPKYYIQSGTVSFVVSACDPEGAALWAMHRMMDEKICDYEDQIMNSVADPFSLPISETEIEGVPEAIPYEAMLNGLAMFDENICLLYTSPSPRDLSTSRMPSSA